MTRNYCNHFCPCILECEATCALECKKGSKVTDIVKGARVRVTFEGVVMYGGETQGLTWVLADGAHHESRVPASAIEVIAPPERQFEDGAYYLAPRSGAVYTYSKNADKFATTIKGGGAYFYRLEWTPERLAAMVKLVPETSS